VMRSRASAPYRRTTPRIGQEQRTAVTTHDRHPAAKRMLQRLAAWCYRRRRRVLVLWIVALIAVGAIGSSVGSTFSQGLSLSGTESQRAADLLQSRFPARAGDEGQIVFAHPGGVQDAAVQTRMEALFRDVAAVPGVTAVTSPYSADGAQQVSRDGDVAYAIVQFDRVAPKIPDSTIERIRTLADGAVGGGVHVALGGRMFQEFSGVGPAELIGILAAIVILLVAFGSLLAMGLPILIALFGIGIGLGFVELLSHVIATPDFATQLASMIGIGVGIDYALLIVTRYRQGLGEGLDPEHAVVRAIDTAGRAVVFAGCTVFISLLGLFLMGVDFVNGMAVGTSFTVGIVMLASITLLPAILGFAGRTIDRFSVRRTRVEKPREQSLWFRWSRVVQRRPWPAFAGGLVILVVLAIPLLSMRLAFPDAGGNPTTDTTRQAHDLVADGFGAGFNGPLILAAEFPKGADTRPLDALVAQLRSMPDVAAVTAPTLSPSGDAAVIRVIPASSPQSVSTTDLVDTLRDDVIPASVAGSDVQVHVGGLTASSIDVSDRLASRLPIFIGAVLVLSFLLLMAVFRSLLVPLKAVIMNLLSIGAAYGVVVAVFEWGWLSGVLGVEQTGPIAPFVPMMMFAILFGLSMDYEVFLLSRIREEYDRTGDNAVAVADGLASTARVITAAALIMVTVFGSFVLGDATTIKLFGLGLATAILVDATVVRMVLVPATMELLGDRNWWFPAWLDRIIPRLHVEAGPDVDAELARLTEEESVTIASP
jgi:putative drug exporter of the RND superfamily